MSNDTTGLEKVIGLEPSWWDNFSPTDIGMILDEQVECQQCDDVPEPSRPQKAKSSHKQNARKLAKLNRKKR